MLESDDPENPLGQSLEVGGDFRRIAAANTRVRDIPPDYILDFAGALDDATRCAVAVDALLSAESYVAVRTPPGYLRSLAAIVVTDKLTHDDLRWAICRAIDVDEPEFAERTEKTFRGFIAGLGERPAEPPPLVPIGFDDALTLLYERCATTGLLEADKDELAKVGEVRRRLRLGAN